MIQELVTDLDLEVVGEEFEEPSESFESSDGELFGFGEVGEDRAKTLLEDLLLELLLMSENASESVVGDDHDLGSGRVDVLEVDRDDAGRKEKRRGGQRKARRKERDAAEFEQRSTHRDRIPLCLTKKSVQAIAAANNFKQEILRFFKLTCSRC